jgi:hypothetical protein
LFNPRRDNWHDHFEWYGATLVGKTSHGRATIAVLAINERVRTQYRAALMAEKDIGF